MPQPAERGKEGRDLKAHVPAVVVGDGAERFDDLGGGQVLPEEFQLVVAVAELAEVAPTAPVGVVPEPLASVLGFVSREPGRAEAESVEIEVEVDVGLVEGASKLELVRLECLVS